VNTNKRAIKPFSADDAFFYVFGNKRISDVFRQLRSREPSSEVDVGFGPSAPAASAWQEQNDCFGPNTPATPASPEKSN
jgi:hypothetical protein